MSRFRTLWTRLVLALALMAFTSTAMADGGGENTTTTNNTTGRSAPEIDPSSIGSALALLGFAATILVDRRRRK